MVPLSFDSLSLPAYCVAHDCQFMFIQTKYRKVASRSTCTIQKIKSLGVLQFEFYVVKGGATNQDMSLTETC